MGEVILICAMGLEARALPANCRVVTVGVGFAKAARGAADAIQRYRPDVVLSVGTCGGLDPLLQIGDVCCATKVLSPVGNFDCLPLAATPVALYSQDRVAVTAADKRALFHKGASIVDMEAAMVARECEKLGVRFGCLKAVSDLASEDLPLDFNRFRGPDGDFQNARIAFAGIMKIRALIRLQQQSKTAARQLGAALDHVIANIT